MKTIYYSDIAAIPTNVCASALDDDLKYDPSDSAHKWDKDGEPVTCSECGVEQDEDNK